MFLLVEVARIHTVSTTWNFAEQRSQWAAEISSELLLAQQSRGRLRQARSRQMRRIGILMNPGRLAALRQALQQVGWRGRNVQIDIRWGEDTIDLERKYAAN